jgi:hypothetical protein
LGILITYCIGIVCIVFPKRAIKVIQAIADHLLKIASKRNSGAVSAEDMVIGPKFSVVIGVSILGITAFAQAMKSV